MNARTVGWFGLGLLCAAGSAGAHHGFGTFAMNEDIELTGIITSFDFVNPHSWVHFDVTEGGKTVNRRCELRSATTLRRSGWTTEMFAKGTRITINGSPDRTDPLACYVSTIAFQDGTTLDRYGQRIPAQPTTERAPRTPSGEPNITGDWAQEQLVMTDPRGRDGTLVPLSQAARFEPGGVPEGQREIAGARGTPEAATPRTPSGTRPPLRGAVDLTEAGTAAMQALADIPRAVRSCAPGSIISDWGGEGVNRITQNADTITLQYGRLGLERTIHMGQRTHPANIEPSRAGHSIGWWDNDVLVVDTIGFTPGTLTGNTPHSAELHVIERIALNPTTMTLRREYSADDTLYFSEPYVRSDNVSPSSVPYNPEPCEDLTPVASPAPSR